MTRSSRLIPRKQPKQERARFTVDALLEATTYILGKLGYDKASTNRIAEAAGVNIASLYQYFPTKEALVAALIDRHLKQISKVFREKMEQVAKEPFSSALRSLILAHIAIHTSHPKLHKILLEQVPRVQKLNPIVRFRSEMKDLVQQWLDERRTEISVNDTRLAAFTIVHTVDALAQAAILEQPDFLEDGKLANQVSRMLLRYLQ